MSTRCQIGIYPEKETELKDYEILIYNHSDGYPEGMLPILEPLCKLFQKRRGLSDTEYVGAWLVYELIDAAVKHNIEFNKEYKCNPDDGKNFIGFGICGDKQIHGDIEYFYAVYPDRLEAFSVSDCDSGSMEKWEKITTIPL